MGSPGTFSLSPKKSAAIGNVLASGAGRTAPKGLTEPAPLAAAFFRELFRHSDWTGLITGREWRRCASLLVQGVSAAHAHESNLESWVEKQKIDLTSEAPLIEWGDRWLEQLDRELSQRDIIAFELSTYALRQTLEELFAPEGSPFDLNKDQLLEGLKKVETSDAFKTYVRSYLRQVIRHIVGGYPPGNAEKERERTEFMRAVEQEEIPKLADQFLNSLERYSSKKVSAGRAISKVLEDVPEWMEDSKKILTGEVKK
jgi:hypothetical protein